MGAMSLSLGTPWKGAVLILVASIGKDFLLYQKDHPVLEVELEEEAKK
jgi:hypothetical protein